MVTIASASCLAPTRQTGKSGWQCGCAATPPGADWKCTGRCNVIILEAGLPVYRRVAQSVWFVGCDECLVTREMN